MSTPVEAIPDGLTKQIKKVSAYRKNVAKVQINTASTAAATDTIEIQLPTKGIIDFTDLIFQATCTITNTTGGTTQTFLPEPEEFFRRVTLECDGATICDTDYYNDVFCMYKNATCSTSHARLRSCYSNDAFGYRKRLDSCTLADATNAGSNTLFRQIAETTAVGPAAMVATNSATSGFIIRDVYEPVLTAGAPRLNATVFLGIQNLGYIDASIMPSMRLKLQLANNNILGATAAASSFVLSQMTLLVPQIILPSYTNNLLQMLAPDQNGNSETLYYKFKRYLPYIFASNPSNINSLKFSLSSSSLDRIWLTMKGAGFGTQAALIPGDPINYFKYSANEILNNFAEIQYVTITVDNEALDGGVKDDLRVNGYIRNLQELALLNNTQFDNLIDSNFNFKSTAADSNTAGGIFARSEFKRCKWYYVKSLCYEGDNQALSGYNCMGSLANIQVDVEFDAAVVGALTFIVVAECSALLAVSAGRTVSLVL